MSVVIIEHAQHGYECHKVGCRDLAKKEHKINHSWEEENLEVAERNFNDDLSVENGYEEPWVWADHVRVYPCAKG
jgi:hypothetical protein